MPYSITSLRKPLNGHRRTGCRMCTMELAFVHSAGCAVAAPCVHAGHPAFPCISMAVSTVAARALQAPDRRQSSCEPASQAPGTEQQRASQAPGELRYEPGAIEHNTLGAQQTNRAQHARRSRAQHAAPLAASYPVREARADMLAFAYACTLVHGTASDGGPRGDLGGALGLEHVVLVHVMQHHPQAAQHLPRAAPLTLPRASAAQPALRGTRTGPRARRAIPRDSRARLSAAARHASILVRGAGSTHATSGESTAIHHTLVPSSRIARSTKNATRSPFQSSPSAAARSGTPT
jgi:hypothetical protein